MSDETADQPAPEGQQPDGQPTMVVNAQYVKDLSFENPNAPGSLMEQSGGPPNIEVGIDTAAVQMEGSTFEVTLTVRAEGTSDGNNLFLVEAAYAGIFTLGEVPEEYVAPLLYVEAPRLLFPFARAIIAECVRDGGFPPLLIHPVDFMALFQQRAAQQAEAEAGQSGAAEPSGNAAPNGDGEQKFEFEL